MTWAKLDDRFHSHPKTIRTWERSPAALGLLVRAIAWSAAYELDGLVPDDIFTSWVPDEIQREELISVLHEVGFLERNEHGWMLHDFCDCNKSRGELERGREARRRAGHEGGKASGRARKGGS